MENNQEKEKEEIIELDEEQQTLFNEFNLLLNETTKNKLSKKDCLRFLRARKWNITKAAEMANNWDAWYTRPIPGAGDVTPETILNNIEDKNEEVYRRLMPHSNMYEDKGGRPIYWELTGEISSRFSEVLQSLTCEDLVIRHIRQQELMVKRLEYASKKYNKSIEQQVIVFNLANLSYSVDTNAMSVFRQTLSIDEAYYPERLHCLYMINAPWFFTAIWSMIRPWLDPVTANKIQIIGSDFIGTLREHIDDNQIPPLYGGTGQDFTWQWPFPPEYGCHPDLFNESNSNNTPDSFDIQENNNNNDNNTNTNNNSDNNNNNDNK